MTTGSMLACAPTLSTSANIRISKLSAADVITPARLAMAPADIGMTCWARMTSGFGSLQEPIVDHRPRPGGRLLRGLEQRDQRSAPNLPCGPEQHAGACQPGDVHIMAAACITGVSPPSGSLAVTVLAYAKPVASLMGKASISARSITVGPLPLFSTPTTPVPPTPSDTSNPAPLSRAATTPAVRRSCVDSSG